MATWLPCSICTANNIIPCCNLMLLYLHYHPRGWINAQSNLLEIDTDSKWWFDKHCLRNGVNIRSCRMFCWQLTEWVQSCRILMASCQTCYIATGSDITISSYIHTVTDITISSHIHTITDITISSHIHTVTDIMYNI